MDKAQVQKSPSTTTGKQNTQGTKTRALKNNHQSDHVANSSLFQPHTSANNLTPGQLIHLQRTLGNQAVGRIIQAKLSISEPDDPYEREADQVADKVMRMPDSVTSGEEETKVQTKPLSSQITPLVHRMPEKIADEEQPLVQAKQEEGAEYDEEAVVATKPLLQRMAGAEAQEDEDTVAPKLASSADVPIQRQSDEEEEPLQAKFEMGSSPQQEPEEKQQEIDPSGSVIHRQTVEDEAVQTKALPYRLPQVARISPVSVGSAHRAIQRLCTECAEEKHQEDGKPEMAQRKQARYQLHDDHDEEEQRVQPKGVGTPTPQVTPSVAANIHALNHGGSPLPKATRAFFEPRFGVDLSGVRVHTGSQAAETAKSINARAFTVGQNIAFGGGQYAPESQDGRKLLAHELTHTIQQGGTVKRKEESEQPPSTIEKEPLLKNTNNLGVDENANEIPEIQTKTLGNVPQIQKSEGVLGSIWDKAKNIGSSIKENISGIATNIREGVGDVVESVKGLVSSGIEGITNGWNNLKGIATSGLDSFQSVFGRIVQVIKAPFNTVVSAIMNFDATLLTIGWQGFLSFVNGIWLGFKALGTSILRQIQTIWSGINAFVSSLFNRINSITQNIIFRNLPSALQSAAQNIINRARQIWQQIQSAWQTLFNKMESIAKTLFKTVENFINQLKSFGIQNIIAAIKRFGALVKKVREVIKNPNIIIEPIVNWIVSQLQTTPSQFNNEASKQIKKDNQEKDEQKQVTIMRSPQTINDPSPQRSSISVSKMIDGVIESCSEKWRGIEANLKNIVWDMIKSMVWPPATGRAIGEATFTMFEDIKKVVSGLYKVNSLQDFWTNFLHLFDIIIIIWRFANTLAGLLFVYFFLAMVAIGASGGTLAGAILGAGVGAAPGVGAGAAAGAAFAGSVGLFLLKSFLIAEALNIVLHGVNLISGLNTEDEQRTSFNRIADSIIGLIAAGILTILTGVAAKIAAWLMNLAKGIFSILKNYISTFKKTELPKTEPPVAEPPKTEPPVIDPAVVKAKKLELFNRAKQINKRAEALAKKFGKETDPELSKISESNDDILTRVNEAEPNKLDSFEKTLDENAKKLDEFETKFGEEVTVKVEKLKESAKWQRKRAYKAADVAVEKGGDKYTSDLTKIATDADHIETELAKGTPDSKTLNQFESTLEKNNRNLRDIEHGLGIASKFVFVEEYEPGKYRLKPEYAENWRQRYYECDYSKATYDEIERLKTTPPSQGGWAHPTDPKLIWDSVQGKFVDATLPENTITVDHTPQAVVEHWNAEGNNMGQGGRHAFFRDGSNHKIVLQKYNSAGGGKLKGQFNPDVGSNFTGPGEKR